jgi:hypothetical protein
VDARVDTWRGVLAVHHQKLLSLAEVLPDVAESMLEQDELVSFEVEKQLEVGCNL